MLALSKKELETDYGNYFNPEGPKDEEGLSCLQLPASPLHMLRKSEHSRMQGKDKEEEYLWMFIHCFWDNQGPSDVSVSSHS